MRPDLSGRQSLCLYAKKVIVSQILSSTKGFQVYVTSDALSGEWCLRS